MLIFPFFDHYNMSAYSITLFCKLTQVEEKKNQGIKYVNMCDWKFEIKLPMSKSEKQTTILQVIKYSTL